MLIGAAATVTLVAACGSPENEPTGSSGPVTSSAKPTTPPAPPTTDSGGVADIAADRQQDLCTRIEGQLSDWRVQGPTLSTPALNITVQEWAFNAGGLALNSRVLTDRTIPDKITTTTCADVRQQAIEALNLPDLATGLAGLPG
ncbi:hypothetical protein JGU72_09415 [Antrihabitans sp. YC2-6]|nr:hypothetical protein [Antrihabitans sp. YC2-6]